MKQHLFLLFLVFSLSVFGQGSRDSIIFNISYPHQSTKGPGGSTYHHDEVVMHDFAKKPHGYWLFTPAQPTPVDAPVIVFNHGYGAYNPMIYGRWIKHLVRKGNIVIYPRYQRNLLTPKPKKFASKAARGIRDALKELENGAYPKPIVDNFAYVGHSYGGVISANLAVNSDLFELPKSKVLMMCAPGTAAFKGGRLDSYIDLPSDLKLLIVTSEHDDVVGDEFAWLVYNTATKTQQRNLIQQFADPHGNDKLSAGHNECYSIDKQFDTGVRNYTAKRALRISELNPIDYNGYWKLLDAALNCASNGKDCTYALGNTPAQKQLGFWSDGKPIKPLKIIVPKTEFVEKF